MINVAFTVLALRLLDRAGRRTLLMIGVSGMTISLLALGGAFVGGGYAAIGVLTLVFCWKLVPETKGKSLEEIEAEFEARARRRGVAPIPPGPVEPVG